MSLQREIKKVEEEIEVLNRVKARLEAALGRQPVPVVVPPKQQAKAKPKQATAADIEKAVAEGGPIKQKAS